MESHENKFTVNRPGLTSPSPSNSPAFPPDISALDVVPRRLYTASLFGFFAAYQPRRSSRSSRNSDKNKAA